MTRARGSVGSVRSVGSVVLAATLLACGAQVAEAPQGVHPPNDAVAVPYPPPAAKVEEVSARPNASCVWVDGYWDFSDRWEWLPGEWVSPRADCRLAPVEVRRQGGRLLYSRPRWYPQNVTLLGPQSACPRPPACGSGPAEVPSQLAPER